MSLEPREYPWEIPIARYLKVPPAPEAPAGSAGSVRIFRAAGGFYLYKVVEWALSQLGVGAGLAFGISFVTMVPDVGLFGIPLRGVVKLFEFFAVMGFLAQLPVTFAMVHMDYRVRWYIVTDRSLRIREGIWRVREQTMTFSNIQNMAIRQGPLQRILGIEDLEVRTAGGGGEDRAKEHGQQLGASNMHLAYFRGVDHAAEIRESILAHLRGHGGAGLGDPEDVEHRDHGAVSEAAAELLEAARSLRLAAEYGNSSNPQP